MKDRRVLPYYTSIYEKYLRAKITYKKTLKREKKDKQL